MIKYLLFSLVCSVSVAQGAELHRRIAATKLLTTLTEERDNLLATPIHQLRTDDSRRIDFLNEIITWAQNNEPSYVNLIGAVNSYSHADNSLPQHLTRSVSAPSSVTRPQTAVIAPTPVSTAPARPYFAPRRRIVSCPPSLKFPDIEEELDGRNDVFTSPHRTFGGDVHPSQTKQLVFQKTVRGPIRAEAVLSEEDEITA